MDYNSIHGPGISNFSSPSPHRMPTVSAAKALQDLESSPTRCISTGLKDLDCVLQRRELDASDGEPFYGGISRGKVTEVYGPPGVGKTTLGIQLAASTLHASEGVIWVDASHPLSGPRLTQILASFKPLHPSSSEEPLPLSTLLSNLTHITTPTLSHLLAFLSLPTRTYPPPNTTLLILDSLSTLISNAFPKITDSHNTSTPRKSGRASRKLPILQSLLTTLQKLALTRNIAILILSQTITKMRPKAGAVLIPAINSTAWDQGLTCRVALFRDWGWEDEHGNSVTDVRSAEVIKAEGIAYPEGRGRVVGFGIGEGGLRALIIPKFEMDNSQNPYQNPELPILHTTKNSGAETGTTITLPQKRKFEDTVLEIPDSEGEDDEDYGWAEEDEEDLPPMPPQWQGSEDIFVRGEGHVEDEGDGEEHRVSDGGEGEDDGGGGGEGGGATKRTRYEIEDSEDELAL